MVKITPTDRCPRRGTAEILPPHEYAPHFFPLTGIASTPTYAAHTGRDLVLVLGARGAWGRRGATRKWGGSRSSRTASVVEPGPKSSITCSRRITFKTTRGYGAVRNPTATNSRGCHRQAALPTASAFVGARGSRVQRRLQDPRASSDNTQAFLELSS